MPSEKVNVVELENNSSESEQDKYCFSTGLTSKSNLYHEVIFEGGESHKFVIDSSSPISFLPISDAHALGIIKLNQQLMEMASILL